MNSGEIRERFLSFFERHGHVRVPSSSLVPDGDPSLLFTNAGMVQFKGSLLGRERRGSTRVTSCQRCMRAGGKHNDLENVGHTPRHHTFFEMLGNFSFGDYFKEEAIAYAWQFLTRELALSEERLWVTVHRDDAETAEVWLRRIGLDRERLQSGGDEDNFWSMGETGPCGPCTEIFYGPGRSAPEERVEIWNLVFAQYDRAADGSLRSLSSPAVDTGMGLERISAVMQGVRDNYETDLFIPLLRALDGMREAAAPAAAADVVSRKVVVDHVRAVAFLVADGVLPSNEERGYVLRRLVRRAARHGQRLGFREPFLHRLTDALAEAMAGVYPELTRSLPRIRDSLLREEERFRETLEQGLRHLEECLAGLDGGRLPGETVFRLYDTYGFPADLTADIARERGLELDQAGFERAMEAQRRRARRAQRFVPSEALPGCGHDSEFLGYETLEGEGVVLTLLRDGKEVPELREGEAGNAVLDRTPFYAESGGQVGDQGQLLGPQGRFAVEDTQKLGRSHVHIGAVREGRLRVGERLQAQVCARRRNDTMRNHSATHLLHAALRERLGSHVAQQGSLVAPDRMRFDFSHPRPLTPEECRDIERRVNEVVLQNAETRVCNLPLQQALASGALALCGEKYEDPVRVLEIGGGFSRELCGGTHVHRGGDIGLFKIVAETGVAAGVRRIEAVTGNGALDWAALAAQRLDQVASLLGSADAEGQVGRLLERNRALEKELAALRSRLAQAAGEDLVAGAREIGGIKVVARQLEDAGPQTLRQAVDRLKDRLGTAAMVLASVSDKGKVILVAGVTRDSTDRIRASELVNFVALQVGGRGGGRADMAQAGGDNPAALTAALDSVPEWVRERIGAGGEGA
ncbi:MAG: alanine--tRNA ligase [Gammaproteobacteria bacterium]|nr:alanine--tRNA ligase [Gammaproteobacteria bacterium]